MGWWSGARIRTEIVLRRGRGRSTNRFGAEGSLRIVGKKGAQVAADRRASTAQEIPPERSTQRHRTLCKNVCNRSGFEHRGPRRTTLPSGWRLRRTVGGSVSSGDLKSRFVEGVGPLWQDLEDHTELDFFLVRAETTRFKNYKTNDFRFFHRKKSDERCVVAPRLIFSIHIFPRCSGFSGDTNTR